MKGKLKLVVLNACFSELQAKQIVKHVDFVVGMNDSVDDDVAAIFAAAFYRALGFGKSVRNAFDEESLQLPCRIYPVTTYLYFSVSQVDILIESF